MNKKYFLLGLGFYLFSLGLQHLEAPHWLALVCTLAAVVFLVLYLRQTGLPERKLAWLRRMLGREQ